MKQKDAAIKQKLSGGAGFEGYYSALFKERWQSLKSALGQEPLYVTLDFSGGGGSCQPYYMDAASVCAALCLPVTSGGKVLDMCAAPGGKSLVLAGGMGEDTLLYSNELSADRKKRLDKVLDDCIPADRRNHVITSCSDGATWCRREGEAFASILLDAPCSSERHVLADGKYLSQWSASRIKSLATRQWALLSSAWRLLAPGGFLLYATCALSPDENDGVVSRLFKKFPDAFQLKKAEARGFMAGRLDSFQGQILGPDGSKALDSLLGTFDSAEETGFGLHLRPDTCGGAGPLYFSLLHKLLKDS